MDKKIAAMKQGGKILKAVFEHIEPMIKAGITTVAIDNEIDKFIISQRADAGFKTVPNYHHASCITINEQVVHTRPSSRIIKPGDVVTIDAGVLYQGYHTDKAITYQVDPKTNNVTKFLEIGQSTLELAIKQTVIGNYIWDISHVIETNLNREGYKVIFDLTGHGVGERLHMDPFIPGFISKKRNRTEQIISGMTLAIEVIYSIGSHDIKPEAGDDWSLLTADNSLSACFEDTILVTENKPLILT